MEDGGRETERFHSQYELEEKFITKSYLKTTADFEVMLEWGDYSPKIMLIVK